MVRRDGRGRDRGAPPRPSRDRIDGWRRGGELLPVILSSVRRRSGAAPTIGGTALLLALACAPPRSTAPVPAPPRGPTEAERAAARADSARVRARQDSIRTAAAVAAARAAEAARVRPRPS